jgi:hypothetical protein
MITTDDVMTEARRCRDLLAYDTLLKIDEETSKVIAEISFEPVTERELRASIEQSILGLDQAMRIREILRASLFNLGLFEGSSVEEKDPYTYRATWVG